MGCSEQIKLGAQVICNSRLPILILGSHDLKVKLLRLPTNYFKMLLKISLQMSNLVHWHPLPSWKNGWIYIFSNCRFLLFLVLKNREWFVGDALLTVFNSNILIADVESSHPVTPSLVTSDPYNKRLQITVDNDVQESMLRSLSRVEHAQTTVNEL